MKNLYNLTIKQAKYLISVIYLGIIFKIITSKDIDYNEGKINKINGIDFKKKEIILSVDIYDVKMPLNCIVIEEKNSMNSNWQKYLESLEKLIQEIQ